MRRPIPSRIDGRQRRRLPFGERLLPTYVATLPTGKADVRADGKQPPRCGHPDSVRQGRHADAWVCENPRHRRQERDRCLLWRSTLCRLRLLDDAPRSAFQRQLTGRVAVMVARHGRDDMAGCCWIGCSGASGAICDQAMVAGCFADHGCRERDHEHIGVRVVYAKSRTSDTLVECLASAVGLFFFRFRFRLHPYQARGPTNRFELMSALREAQPKAASLEPTTSRHWDPIASARRQLKADRQALAPNLPGRKRPRSGRCDLEAAV